jgi:hypothetical protein
MNASNILSGEFCRRLRSVFLFFAVAGMASLVLVVEVDAKIKEIDLNKPHGFVFIKTYAVINNPIACAINGC